MGLEVHPAAVTQDDDAPRGRVVLVAFLEQDNLGVGYLASMLMQRGYDPYIVDFRLGEAEILANIRKRSPLLVGFSVIFQHHILLFTTLIQFLRDNGVRCHFTAGGHYPSLRWDELLQLAPGLDSVVLFEGEHTLARLVQAVERGADWRGLNGIAWVRGGVPTANPLAALEDDLDNFPPPLRQPLREITLGRRFATILASRGCRHNCMFCSIRQFYAAPPGSLKRIRDPEMVVEEMLQLRDQMGCSVYMFQDDDFPVGTAAGCRWVERFCQLLRQHGLADDALWKISCRADEIEEDVVALMRDHGLFLVYMGIESGTDEGLRLMNKRTSVARTLESVGILKRLGVCFDYGFMMFAPWTTPELIRGDLNFLDRICADGSTCVTFCKMLPYAATQIEAMLRSTQRLHGPVGGEDYDFDEPAVARAHDAMNEVFFTWIARRDGLLNRCRWMRYELAVVARSPGGRERVAPLVTSATATIAAANRLFIDTAREIVDLAAHPLAPVTIATLRRKVDARQAQFGRELAVMSTLLDDAVTRGVVGSATREKPRHATPIASRSGLTRRDGRR